MQESTAFDVSRETFTLLNNLGVPREAYAAGRCTVYSPISGVPIGRVPCSTPPDTTSAIGRAHEASYRWQTERGPRRGHLASLIGEELEKVRPSLQRLMMLELGRTPEQSATDVQEMIVVCGFAARVARQPNQPTQPNQPLQSQGGEPFPHAIGCGCCVASVGSLSAAILALARGAAVLWTPSDKAPLTALAIHAAVRRAIANFGTAPEGLVELLLASRALADLLHPTGICGYCGGEQALQAGSRARRAAHREGRLARVATALDRRTT
jgi:aldehyde dehydrogenase (NAD+)